jgi:hypothetical protein
MSSKREIRKLLLEAADLGKKAERSLTTPVSLQTFVERCETNKTTPKFLRDLEELGAHASRIINALEERKDAKETKETKETKEPKEAKETKEPKPDFTSMDFLASFTGKTIAAVLLPQIQQTQKGGGAMYPKKKKAIPAALRKQVWNHYIGAPVGETKCPVCRNNTIDKLGFEAGHVVPESTGGTTTLNNLRPICGECNKSMGALNMQEYTLRYYGHYV